MGGKERTVPRQPGTEGSTLNFGRSVSDPLWGQISIDSAFHGGCRRMMDGGAATASETSEAAKVLTNGLRSPHLFPSPSTSSGMLISMSSPLRI